MRRAFVAAYMVLLVIANLLAFVFPAHELRATPAVFFFVVIMHASFAFAALLLLWDLAAWYDTGRLVTWLLIIVVLATAGILFAMGVSLTMAGHPAAIAVIALCIALIAMACVVIWEILT
jgi:hypothetical protein